MSCEAARERLVDLAYGELPPAEARELEAHLRGCADCRAEALRIEETRRLYRRIGEEPAPGGEGILLAAARQAAERARPRPLPGFGWARLAAGVAAVAVVGGVAFRLLSAQRQDRAEEAYAARPAPAAAGAAAAPEPAGPPEPAPLAQAPAAEAAPRAAAPPAAPRGSLRREAPPAPPPGAAAAAERAGARADREEPRSAPAPRPFAAEPPAAADRSGEGVAAAPREPGPEATAGAARPRAVGVLPEARAVARKAEAAPAAGAGEAFAEELVRDLRRRRDEGRLNEARRQPDPCAGGDSLRLAWLDGWGRARRLARTGPLPPELGAGEATRDQYYDEAGRLRLVVIDGSGPAGRFRRRIVLDEVGRRVIEDPPGPGPWPADDLTLSDPAAAFWAPQRCAR